ncbi:hypothetical protein [Dactylosporangium sp. NPDC051541]|uniref:hypothetical protein n=1 Tax=Dactylosporangium sp. NPDC051541 TaxID=3363977 RepID=UPI00378D094B
MREKTLGRWIVRLAVTIGAGSLVLGLGTVAANADTSTIGLIRKLPAAATHVQQNTASSEQIFFTEDYSWE